LSIRVPNILILVDLSESGNSLNTRAAFVNG
jgi:hypothetical protein